MTSNILGLPSIGLSDKIFDDVPEDHWAFKVISNAFATGTVQGDGEHFYPNNLLSKRGTCNDTGSSDSNQG